jgi:hypothetical protein
MFLLPMKIFSFVIVGALREPKAIFMAITSKGPPSLFQNCPVCTVTLFDVSTEKGGRSNISCPSTNCALLFVLRGLCDCMRLASSTKKCYWRSSLALLIDNDNWYVVEEMHCLPRSVFPTGTMIYLLLKTYRLSCNRHLPWSYFTFCSRPCFLRVRIAF